MSHFAKVIDGKVVEVIVIEQDVLNTGHWGDPSLWIQTSYNTRGGVHLQGGTPLRKNYAGVGYTYDSERDAFYAPQPYPSWSLDETSCTWQAPFPAPEVTDDSGYYTWDESVVNWSFVIFEKPAT